MHSKRLAIISGAAVIAVVAILVLAVLPGPLNLLHPTSYGGAEAFQAAMDATNARMMTVPGGPWTLVSATGTLVHEGYQLNASTATLFGCNMSFPASSFPSGDNGDLQAGLFTGWGFYFTGTNGGLAEAGVVDGTVGVGFVIPGGSSCLHSPPSLLGHAVSNVIDSPDLMRSLQPQLGAWLAANQNASGELGLYFGTWSNGTVTYPNPTWHWNLVLTGCLGARPPVFPFPNGPIFQAFSNATTPGIIMETTSSHYPTCS